MDIKNSSEQPRQYNKMLPASKSRKKKKYERSTYSWKYQHNKRIAYMQAFQEDCETLLLNFKKAYAYDFKTFSYFWKESNFSLIYSGRHRSFELPHFIMMIFFCIKKYAIFSTDKYIQIGSLYLLYGTYYKQPITQLVKIRLLHDEFKIYKDLVEEMHKLKVLDACYIFHKMIQDDAFELTYSSSNYYLDMYSLDYELINDIFPLERSNIKETVNEGTKESMNEVYEVDKKYQALLKEYMSEKDVMLITYPLQLKENINAILEKEDSMQVAGTSASTIETEIRETAKRSFKKKVTVNRRYRGKKEESEDTTTEDDDADEDFDDVEYRP